MKLASSVSCLCLATSAVLLSQPEVTQVGGIHRIKVPLVPSSSKLETATITMDASEYDEPRQITLPTTTIPVDINWCTALQTLPGLPAALRSFQLCNRSSPSCQSVQGALEVCGTITELRTRGSIRVGGSLDADFNVTPGGVTPGQPAVFSPCNRTPKIPDPCSITGLCTPGLPVLVATAKPAVFYPCNQYPLACAPTAGACIVGAPVLIQAIPPKFETCRLVRAAVPEKFETCKLVKPPVLPQVKLPALAQAGITGGHLIDAQLTNTLAGKGSVELQIPLPALAFTATTEKSKSNGQPGKTPEEDPLVALGATVMGGFFVYLSGEVSETRLTIDASVDSRTQLNLVWTPNRGWLDQSRVLANTWRAGVRLDTPERIVLRAGLRPLESVNVALKVKGLTATELNLTQHLTPYLEDVWTRPSARNWRHNVDSGVQLFQEASLKFPPVPIFEPVNAALTYRFDQDLVRGDVFDLFGRGDLQVQVNAPNAPPGSTFGLSLDYVNPGTAPLRAISTPSLRFSAVAPGQTVRFSEHPQVRDFKAPCEVDPALAGRPPLSFNCELVAEEHILRVELPLGCAVSGANPRRIRLQPDATVTETFNVACGPGAGPGPSPITGRPKLLPAPEALVFQCQTGAARPPSQVLVLAGESSEFNAASASAAPTWLSVSPRNARTPARLVVSVDPAGLAPGEYLQFIRVSQASASSQFIEVPVRLIVAAAARPILSPDSVFLETMTGATAPATATLSVVSSGSALSVSASASGGNWLSVTPGNAPVAASGGEPVSLKVNASAAALAPGTYSGSIRLTAANGAAVNVPVTFTVRTNRLSIAQIVDGNDWKTTIILVNTDNEPSPFVIRFYAANGAPIAVDLESGGKVMEYSATIPVNGTHVIETDGTEPELTQGWAEVTATRAIGGRAIFRQRDSSDRNSEAAVPLKAFGGQPMLLPFDNTGGFTTAAAFLNSSDSQSGTLTLRFRDEAGALIGTGGLSLAPRNRQAFALSERFSAIANRRGVAEITSSGGELNVLGLRFNPRGAFTSFETVDIEDATDTTTRSVAQIADGNNWKTTMVLVNNGAEAAPFSLRFRNPNGATLTLPVTGYGAVSELFDVIPVGGSRTIETSGASMALVQGWAELTTPQSIGGTVVFRQRGVATDSEAVVRLMPNPGPVFVLPFDNTDGLVSAAALVNHADAARSVTVTFRDEEGREILTERLTVAAKGREAFGLPDQFPRLANQRGSAEFSGGAISVLGLRFNPLGSFTSVAPIKK